MLTLLTGAALSILFASSDVRAQTAPTYHIDPTWPKPASLAPSSRR